MLFWGIVNWFNFLICNYNIILINDLIFIISKNEVIHLQHNFLKSILNFVTLFSLVSILSTADRWQNLLEFFIFFVFVWSEYVKDYGDV